MKTILSLIVFAFFALFAATLYLENPESINLKYYFGVEFNIELVWVLLVPFFIGAVFGVLLMSLSVFKHKHRANASRRKLAKVEKEVENLRAMPLKDEV